MDNLYQIKVNRGNWTENVRIQSAKPQGEILPADFGLEVSEFEAWSVEFLGEIFIRKLCACWNYVTCIGIVESDKSVTITTEIDGIPSAGLVADTLVQCTCGRKYRTPSRRAWTNIKLHEMVKSD